MPLFMLRSKPYWIVIASFGSIMPAVHAEEPPCPSQNEQAGLATPAAQTAAATAQTSAAAAPAGTAAATGSTAAADGGAAQAAGTPPASASGAVPAAGDAKPTGAGMGAISVTSDQATLGVDGNATLRGN